MFPLTLLAAITAIFAMATPLIIVQLVDVSVELSRAFEQLVGVRVFTRCCRLILLEL